MKNISEIELRQLLNKLGEDVLKLKIHRMENLLKIAVPDEALYRELMLSLGYPKNKLQFLELALILPYKEIVRFKNIKPMQTKSIIENALLYRAGFSNDSSGFPEYFDTSLRMNKSYWVYKSIRPANFPDKRIRDISYLLYETIDKGIYNYFKSKIQDNVIDDVDKLSAKKVVEKVMSFKGIGITRKREMFFNIILPFFLADDTFNDYHNFLMNIFENHPALEINSTIKKFYKDHKLKITTVKEYFGAIKYVNKDIS